VIATVPVPADTRFAASGPQAHRFIVAGKRGARVIDANGQVLAELPHPARVHRAAFSPNGLLIATAGADGDAIVWRSSGAQLRVLPGPSDSESDAFDVSFSPLSRLLVVASSDGAARVWNVRNGHRESVMPLHGTGVRRARFGVNEDSVLTASRDQTARTWKVTTGGPRAVFAGHSETVTAAVFIPGADKIATASEDGTVRTWVAQLQPSLRPALATSAPRITLDPRATVSGSTVTLRLHGRNVTLTGHRDDVLSVEVSRDGSRVVTASKDGDARLWDARTGEPLWVLRGHSGTVFDASFSPNGRFVVTGGPTTAGVWDTAAHERFYFLQGHRGPVRAAMFSSPTRIVTRGDDGIRVYVCDICGGLHELVALAEQRLATTDRKLSADERLKYLGER
jgi:WD40 repeat protein